MSEHFFEVVEHTADVGIRSEASSLPRLFSNIAMGMTSLMADPRKVEPAESKKIEIEAEDLEGLLVEWLNELIYLIDAENLIFSRFEISDLSETHLAATVSGEAIDPTKHELKVQVKAATYHQLKIEKKDSSWSAQVIFDI